MSHSSSGRPTDPRARHGKQGQNRSVARCGHLLTSGRRRGTPGIAAIRSHGGGCHEPLRTAGGHPRFLHARARRPAHHGSCHFAPATRGPRGGTAAAVRQTRRSIGCHARAGGAHGQRPASYVPLPRLPRLGPQHTHPPTQGQPQPITVLLCGDKPPQSKCVVSRDTMIRSGATAHTAPRQPWWPRPGRPSCATASSHHAALAWLRIGRAHTDPSPRLGAAGRPAGPPPVGVRLTPAANDSKHCR